MTAVAFLHLPIVRGALSGLIAAAIVDVHAFLQWKSVDDVKAFNFKTAALRWTQGAVSGALLSLGLSTF